MTNPQRWILASVLSFSACVVFDVAMWRWMIGSLLVGLSWEVFNRAK